MYYNAAAEEFVAILKESEMTFGESFMINFLEIMSEMCNYTEEDHKVRPQIIIGENLENYFTTISQHHYFVMYSDDCEGNQLPRLFKSLALFCDNGWYIVINRLEEGIEYGLFRRYTEISGERFEDYFKKDFDISINSKMLIVKASNSFEITITRSNQEDSKISQRFVSKKESEDTESIFRRMALDVTSSRDDYDPKQVQDSLVKMFRFFPQKVHGTIVLVVEDSFELPEGVLAGITLQPPIDYYETFSAYEKIESYAEAESVYALTGMLYEMLNTDGITIITNKARVLYYNVFYRGDIPENIRGGARKRTARGILNNDKLSGIIGVYFQSQDGDNFYERKHSNE